MGKYQGINKHVRFEEIFTSHSKTTCNWSPGPGFYTWAWFNLLFFRSLCCPFRSIQPFGGPVTNITDLVDSEVDGKVSEIMKNGIHYENLEIDGWPFRVQQPSQPNEKTKLLLLLHGHLGNENVMWPLINRILGTYYILAPRAPIRLGVDQYSWHEIQPQWPKIKLYEEITDQLIRSIEVWLEEQELNCAQLDVMGFSQGAVLACAFALHHLEKVRKIAALSGFIPQSWQQ